MEGYLWGAKERERGDLAGFGSHFLWNAVDWDYRVYADRFEKFSEKNVLQHTSAKLDQNQGQVGSMNSLPCLVLECGEGMGEQSGWCWTQHVNKLLMRITVTVYEDYYNFKVIEFNFLTLDM